MVPEERGADPLLSFVVRDAEEGMKKRNMCPTSMAPLTIAGSTSHVRSRSVGARRTPRQDRKMRTASPSIATIMSNSLRRSFVSERDECTERRRAWTANGLELADWPWPWDWSIKASSCEQEHGRGRGDEARQQIAVQMRNTKARCSANSHELRTDLVASDAKDNKH